MQRLDFLPIIPFRIWTRILIVAWVILLSVPSFAQLRRAFLPTSYWFTVGDVRVSDAVEGECPFVRSDRVIRRPFVGRYIASIREVGADGFEIVIPPTASNIVHYRPDARLPQQATLQWWMEWRGCYLVSGRYVLDTTWQIEPDEPFSKLVTARSNIFTIRPREGQFP